MAGQGIIVNDHVRTGPGRPPDGAHATAVFTDYSDPGAVEERRAGCGWDIAYTSLERGRFHARLATVRLNDTALIWERRNLATHLLGALEDGRVALALLLSAEGRGLFRGRPFAAGDLLMLAPGRQCDVVSPAGMEAISLSVPANSVRGLAGLLGRSDDLGHLQSVCRAPTGLRQSVAALAASAFHASANTAATLEWTLQRLLLTPFIDAAREPIGQQPALPREQYHVRAACEFIEANLQDESVGLDDIARATGVSARTLQIGFRRAVGISPMAFLRARRLQCVRRLLTDGCPETITVTQAASRFGFSHLGRFSSYYRQAFGELPSESLRSSPRRVWTSHRDADPEGRTAQEALGPPLRRAG